MASEADALESLAGGSSTRYGSVGPIASPTQPCCERTKTSWTPTVAHMRRSWACSAAGSRLAPWKERFVRLVDVESAGGVERDPGARHR
jgi:hypothetical protein